MIRRHWFSSVTFTILHLPLCGGLILASSALRPMVDKSEIEDYGIIWFFGAGDSPSPWAVLDLY
jgi:hypothetical protein